MIGRKLLAWAASAVLRVASLWFQLDISSNKTPEPEPAGPRYQLVSRVGGVVSPEWVLQRGSGCRMRDADHSLVLQGSLHRWQDGGWQEVSSVRFGSARPGGGCSSTRPLAPPGRSRRAFRVGVRQLSSASAPTAAAPPTFPPPSRSGSVQCRFRSERQRRLLIFLFQLWRAEAVGRKERRKKMRSELWEM